MTSGDEIEIKLDLGNELNYNKLLNFFVEKKSVIKQENFFYDSPDLGLSRIGWALRIRREEKNLTATLKGKSIKNIEGLTIRPEIEERFATNQVMDLSAETIDLNNLPENIQSMIKRLLPIGELKQVLHFDNFRTTVELKDADRIIILEIDRTIFPDNSVDYELEIELADKNMYESTKIIIDGILEKQQIPVREQILSKFARAIRRMAEHKS